MDPIGWLKCAQVDPSGSNMLAEVCSGGTNRLAEICSGASKWAVNSRNMLRKMGPS